MGHTPGVPRVDYDLRPIFGGENATKRGAEETTFPCAQDSSARLSSIRKARHQQHQPSKFHTSVMRGVSVEKDVKDAAHVVQHENGNHDYPNRTCDESLSDMESQVLTSLTAVITEQCKKSYASYQPPLPTQRGEAYALPAWLVISIALLSLIGVVGGVMELIVQYHFG